MNQDQKLDAILGVANTTKDELIKLKEKLETNVRDTQELRKDVWGENGLKEKVHSHGFHIAIGKWVGALIAGAAILALVNSYLHIIVK